MLNLNNKAEKEEKRSVEFGNSFSLCLYFLIFPESIFLIGTA